MPDTPTPAAVRYLEGLSGDLYENISEALAGSQRAVLAMDLLSFCTECGCVVYRRDLHDAWHSRLAADAPAADAPALSGDALIAAMTQTDVERYGIEVGDEWVTRAGPKVKVVAPADDEMRQGGWVWACDDQNCRRGDGTRWRLAPTDDRDLLTLHSRPGVVKDGVRVEPSPPASSLSDEDVLRSVPEPTDDEWYGASNTYGLFPDWIRRAYDEPDTIGIIAALLTAQRRALVAEAKLKGMSHAGS